MIQNAPHEHWVYREAYRDAQGHLYDICLTQYDANGGIVPISDVMTGQTVEARVQQVAKEHLRCVANLQLDLTTVSLWFDHENGTVVTRVASQGATGVAESKKPRKDQRWEEVPNCNVGQSAENAWQDLCAVMLSSIAHAGTAQLAESERIQLAWTERVVSRSPTIEERDWRDPKKAREVIAKLCAWRGQMEQFWTHSQDHIHARKSMLKDLEESTLKHFIGEHVRDRALQRHLLEEALSSFASG